MVPNILPSSNQTRQSLYQTISYYCGEPCSSNLNHANTKDSKRGVKASIKERLTLFEGRCWFIFKFWFLSNKKKTHIEKLKIFICDIYN